MGRKRTRFRFCFVFKSPGHAWGGPEGNEKGVEGSCHMFLWKNYWILIRHSIWEIRRQVVPEISSLFDRKNGYLNRNREIDK